MMFWNRTKEEQELINKAFDFEMKAIEQVSNVTNPYLNDIKKMGLWDAFNEAIEMMIK